MNPTISQKIQQAIDGLRPKRRDDRLIGRWCLGCRVFKVKSVLPNTRMAMVSDGKRIHLVAADDLHRLADGRAITYLGR